MTLLAIPHWTTAAAEAGVMAILAAALFGCGMKAIASWAEHRQWFVAAGWALLALLAIMGGVGFAAWSAS